MGERDFDVVVFGASGVTGRRVAGYLAERSSSAEFRWAAAGRDAAKLERELAAEGVSAPESIVAELGDRESLVAMASRAKVVLNLVGPYTLYGEPVIEACVAGGAHYVDLTGEIQFVRRMIAAYGPSAEDAGVKIVQVCGFEALPPDLSVMLAAEAARERWDEDLAEVNVEVTVTALPPRPRPSDLLSGGTSQSLAAAAGDPDSASITDPAALVDDDDAAAAIRARSPIRLAPRRGVKGSVGAPMSPAAFINPAVIHRSAVLRAAEGGREPRPFVYREGFGIRGGTATLPLRYAAAGMVSGMQAATASVARAGPSVGRTASRVLGRVLPSSGAGPKADRLEPWRWRMSTRATTSGGSALTVEVEAEGHPGYLTTARLLGEAGLMLAEKGATPDTSGHLTPAAALGSAHIERFDHARLHFAIVP
jgi:short subunit dehydrogenase-like uncharacterized protein